MAEYIERERLKQAFRSDTEHLQTFDSSMYEILITDINEIPAADVAPVRHGRWETISDPEYVMKDFSCSACEELICDFDTTALWPGQNCYYYCPCCGARMDGDTNA